MCKDCENYNYFPTMTIGGPSGDYKIQCPVVSCQWAEYRVVSLANSTNADSHIIVSGDDVPKALPFDNTKTLTDQAFIRAQVYYALFASNVTPNARWDRITHSQKYVFIRIDTGATAACYVGIQFRTRYLKVIPGPAETVHPEHEQQINLARAHTVVERLRAAGIPERAIEHA